MKKDKKKQSNLNYLLIIISAIIIVLLCYSVFHKEKETIFKFNENNIQLKLGEKKVINYELNDDKLEIKWSSSNDVVSINNNGEMTANKYGKSIITGTVVKDEETYTNTCLVTTYSGDIGVKLEDISVPEGYLLMSNNSEYNIPFTIVPSNAYITSIDYYLTTNNVEINDNKVISKNEGEDSLSIIVNKDMSSIIKIKVSNSVRDNGFVKLIDSVSLDEEEITMDMGEIKTLSYTVTPRNGYLETIEWTSSNEDVVVVDEGDLTAVNVGEATVKLTINNIESTTKVKVKASKAEIKVDYSPKTVIRIGEKTNIKASVYPTNINDTVTYSSSNPSIVSVDNGVVTGINSGVANVTLSIGNGKTKTFTIYVLKKSGSVSGNGYLWGYKSLNAKTPVYANLSFFQKIVSTGIGTLQNNSYIINTGGLKFTYDINASMLYVASKKIKMRIYYPPNEDLSTLNTLVYMGGRGETNFGGAFTSISKDPSIIKSAGIVILIAEGDGTSFDGDSGAYATEFVKAIVRQKSGVKNSILGFSDGAHKVMHASNKSTYDRIVVFSGYTDGIGGLNNAKNSEVMFIIASRDGNYTQAQSALRHMLSSGFTNVTVISNGSDMSKLFSDKYLVINPGSLMKNGHLTENIFLSGIIEYCND